MSPQKNSIHKYTLKFSIMFVAISTCIQIIAYSYIAYIENIHKSKITNERLTQYLSESLIDPLSLGNYIEALRRLDKLKELKVVSCAKIIIDNKDINNCSFLKTDPVFNYVANLPSNVEKKFELQAQYVPEKLLLYSAYKLIVFIIIFILSAFFLLNNIKNIFKSIGNDLDNIVSLNQDAYMTKKNYKFSWQEFEKLQIQLEEIIAENLKRNSAEKITKLSQQLAHDIRSPLSVLNLMIPVFMKKQTSDGADLLSQAVVRINDISQELLNESYLQRNKIDLIASLENIIKEKKLLAIKNLEINFSNEVNPDIKINLTVSESDLGRVFSNILNNSIEAPKNNGHKIILIKLSTINSQLIITIEDNCNGIPESVINKIGHEGFSYNKELNNVGTGLGIYNAKNIISTCGGEFKISSVVGKGTTVKLVLPMIS